MTRDHIDAEGRFQSDKYTWCKPDFVPLKLTDPTAQAVLWDYAERRREIDSEFADDLQHRLRELGFDGGEATAAEGAPMIVIACPTLTKGELEATCPHCPHRVGEHTEIPELNTIRGECQAPNCDCWSTAR